MKNYSTTLLLWSIHIHSTDALSFNPNIPHSSTGSINPNQITESFIASEYRQRVDQERYLNDQYMDRRSPKPFGRRDVIDEEYVRSLEERLYASDNARNRGGRGPQRNRETVVDAGYVNNLEARVHDLESKQNSYRQEPRRDDRYARNQDSRASYTERRQDIARGRVPVDQRINNEVDGRRPDEINGKRLANPGRHRRVVEGYAAVDPDKFTDVNKRDGFSHRRDDRRQQRDSYTKNNSNSRQQQHSDYPRDPNLEKRLDDIGRQQQQPPRVGDYPRDDLDLVRRLDDLERQQQQPPRVSNYPRDREQQRRDNPRNNNVIGKTIDEFDRARAPPPRPPRPETKYKENMNVRFDNLENIQRLPDQHPPNTLAIPTNPNIYTQNMESLALTDKKQEVIAYDDHSVANRPNLSQQIFDRKGPTKIQGGALKTFVTSPNVNAVHVVLRSEMRPIDADLELWHGPDQTPYKMRVYIENGSERHFSAMIGAPRGPNTVAIRNTGQLEFPIDACVVADTVELVGGSPIPEESETRYEPKSIEGGALHTYNFDHNIEAVQVLIKTDGRPLNARIELLKGPKDLLQTVEVFSEDGVDRPFFIVIETPGSGNTVKVVNTSELESPMYSWVEPYSISHSGDDFTNDSRMVNANDSRMVNHNNNNNNRRNVPGRNMNQRR